MCKVEVRIERTTERGARVRQYDWAHTCVAAMCWNPWRRRVPGGRWSARPASLCLVWSARHGRGAPQRPCSARALVMKCSTSWVSWCKTAGSVYS